MIHRHFHKRSRALLALMTSVVLVSAMLMAGNAYAWCPHMQQAAPGCCHGAAASRAHDGHGEAQAARGPEVDSPCCETRVVSELPSADLSPAGVLVLPAATVLPEPLLLEEPAPAFLVHQTERVRLGAPIRAGPKTALERCVLLQTLLH